jgi:hypothetical protein
MGKITLPNAHRAYRKGCSFGVQNRAVIKTKAGLFALSNKPRKNLGRISSWAYAAAMVYRTYLTT